MKSVKEIAKIEERMRLETLLTGEYDSYNAILSFCIPGQAERRRRTGHKCFTACMSAGASVTIMK